MEVPGVRTITIVVVLLCVAGLALSTNQTAARPAPPPQGSPGLAGRNCGSLSLLASIDSGHFDKPTISGLSTIGTTSGLQQLPATNLFAAITGGMFDQTDITTERLTLDQRWTANASVDDNETTGQFDPVVVFNTDGEAYYAWSERPERAGDFGDIYFAAGERAGVAQTRRGGRVDDRGGNIDDQFAPSLAITENGLFALAWTDTRNGNSAIYFASSTDQGQTWSVNRPVSRSTELKHNRPFLLAGEQDTLYLIWQATDDTLGYILFAQSDDGGETWTNQTRVNDNVDATTRQNPALARLRNGNLIAAWSDNRNGNLQVFTSRRIPQGQRQVWVADVPVDETSSGDQNRPSLAVGADDLIYLAYEQEVNDVSGIYFTRSDDGGVSWEASMQLNDGTASAIAPSLAVDAAGEPYCGWCEGRGNLDAVYATRSLNQGNVWTTPVEVSDTSGDGIGAPPHLAVTDDGSVKIAWADGRNPLGPSQIYTTSWPGEAYYDEGTYISPVYDGQNEAPWRSLSWTAMQPTGTGVVVAVRLGNTPTPDETWTDWTELASSPADLSELSAAQYAQVRVILTTTNADATPSVSDLILLADRTTFLPIVVR